MRKVTNSFGLMNLLDVEKEHRPHLGQFLDRWRKEQRPIYILAPTEHPRIRPAEHIPSEHILP